MRRYWDLSEKERSALTDEQMAGMEKIELMEEGIVPVAAPDAPVYADVSVPQRQYYRVGFESSRYSNQRVMGCAFETKEQAEQVIALKPIEVETSYDRSPDVAAWPTRYYVQTVNLATREDCDRVRPELGENKKIQNVWETDRQEYTEYTEKRSKALEKMRQDRRDCQGHAAHMERIRNTWDDYVKTCDGDEETARKFLAKAFPELHIASMHEWFQGEPHAE